MKKRKITLLMAAAALIIAAFVVVNSCKKEDKTTPKSNDPCANITCLNGGTCANGICNCPPGYTGSDCGQEIAPTSVTITKIVLINYPMTAPSGGGWDWTSGPDVFLSIDQGTSVSDVQFTNYITDASGGALTFTSNFPYTMTNPSVYYSIGVWDYDSMAANEYMGGIMFVPNNYKTGFPATINLSVGSISMTLYVTWNY